MNYKITNYVVALRWETGGMDMGETGGTDTDEREGAKFYRRGG